MNGAEPCLTEECGSEITIAAYENGVPTIGHIDVVAKHQGGYVRFETANKSIKIADDRLLYGEFTCDEYPNPRVEAFFDVGFGSKHLGADRGGGLTLNGNFLGLAEEVQLENVVQQLDNLVFAKSTFTDCVLVYDGSARTYFAGDDTIVNSTLELGPHASISSPFVVDFKKKYPDVQIVPTATHLVPSHSALRQTN
jgi:hypothetical protein